MANVVYLIFGLLVIASSAQANSDELSLSCTFLANSTPVYYRITSTKVFVNEEPLDDIDVNSIKIDDNSILFDEISKNVRVEHHIDRLTGHFISRSIALYNNSDLHIGLQGTCVRATPKF